MGAQGSTILQTENRHNKQHGLHMHKSMSSTYKRSTSMQAYQHSSLANGSIGIKSSWTWISQTASLMKHSHTLNSSQGQSHARLLTRGWHWWSLVQEVPNTLQCSRDSQAALPFLPFNPAHTWLAVLLKHSHALHELYMPYTPGSTHRTQPCASSASCPHAARARAHQVAASSGPHKQNGPAQQTCTAESLSTPFERTAASAGPRAQNRLHGRPAQCRTHEHFKNERAAALSGLVPLIGLQRREPSIGWLVARNAKEGTAFLCTSVLCSNRTHVPCTNEGFTWVGLDEGPQDVHLLRGRDNCICLL
eukprot:1156865-Pelagomonas_calceolata.AAC.7